VLKVPPPRIIRYPFFYFLVFVEFPFVLRPRVGGVFVPDRIYSVPLGTFLVFCGFFFFRPFLAYTYPLYTSNSRRPPSPQRSSPLCGRHYSLRRTFFLVALRPLSLVWWSLRRGILPE